MPTIVSYDGNRLIPAPFINIQKNYQTTDDGEHIGSVFNITLTGNIVAFAGSPFSSGTFYNGTDYPANEDISSDNRLKAIATKQNAIRDLFSNEGKLLIIKNDAGSVAFSGNPRVLGSTFPENTWYNRSEYSINLEMDELGPSVEDSFTPKISAANESWVLQTNELPEQILLPHSYTLTHTAAATGKRYYTPSGILQMDAWRQAKSWVQARLGLRTEFITSSGTLDLNDEYGGYNHVRSENIDEKGGTYSVTETWVIASGSSSEDFNVTTNKPLDNPLTTVRIEGEIRGFELNSIGPYSITTSKYDNAQTRYVTASGLALTRAQVYSGETLNPIPTLESTIKNPTTGLISYSFEYNDRPTNLITNAKVENIVVSDTVTGGQSYAEIFVLGRTIGPVFQSLGTRPGFERSLNIEIVVPVPTGTITNRFETKNPRTDSATSTDIQSVINGVNPNTAYGTTYSDPPRETWDFINGRYTYNQTWHYIASG